MTFDPRKHRPADDSIAAEHYDNAMADIAESDECMVGVRILNYASLDHRPRVNVNSDHLNPWKLEKVDYNLYKYKCDHCGEPITFIERKPFDEQGAHRCLANAAKLKRDQERQRISQPGMISPVAKPVRDDIPPLQRTLMEAAPDALHVHVVAMKGVFERVASDCCSGEGGAINAALGAYMEFQQKMREVVDNPAALNDIADIKDLMSAREFVGKWLSGCEVFERVHTLV